MTNPAFALLFDENISYRVVKRIIHLFPGSQPANRLKLVAKEDPLLWQTAKANGFSIITYDDDYENLSQLNGWPPKVILLRPGNLSNDEVVTVLERSVEAIYDFLLEQDTDARGVLRLFYVNPN